MRTPWILSLLLIATVPARAGERVKVWIALRDKGPGVSAIAGRTFEDAPVHAAHLQSLREAGVEIVTVLKWQNRVSGWVDPERIGTVAGLSCVRDAEEMPRKAAAPALPGPVASPAAPLPKPGAAAATQDFGAFQGLFASVGAAELRDTLAARGMKAGEGVRIAVMDADFLLGHQAFDSMFARNAIVDQWDFVDDTAAVTRIFGNSHGAKVLSQVGGELPGVLEGLAPHAQFLLYRTEDEANEVYAEEDYLAAALERAVDSGAQVINISLGYRYDFDAEPDFPYADMDGRTRPSSIAAVGAARRGAIVSVAVGNEGLSRFSQPTVTAPADADSILAVGITNAAGVRCPYSGTGPSHDGRIKPELSSPGCSVPVANPSTAVGTSNLSGTSFAAPVVAGVAALLRQLHPDTSLVSSQRIRLALMATAAKASAPDNLTGNGILRAAEAHRVLLWEVPSSRLAAEPGAVKGTLAWRGDAVVYLPWVKGVNLSGSRAWDLNGRARSVRTMRRADDGRTEVRSDPRASGVYVLKIPLDSD